MCSSFLINTKFNKLSIQINEFSEDSFANHIFVEYFTSIHPTLNKSNCANKSKEIEATPLEPKPSISDVLKSEAKTQWDFSNVFSSNVFACLASLSVFAIITAILSLIYRHKATFLAMSNNLGSCASLPSTRAPKAGSIVLWCSSLTYNSVQAVSGPPVNLSPR